MGYLRLGYNGGLYLAERPLPTPITGRLLLWFEFKCDVVVCGWFCDDCCCWFIDEDDVVVVDTDVLEFEEMLLLPLAIKLELKDLFRLPIFWRCTVTPWSILWAPKPEFKEEDPPPPPPELVGVVLTEPPRDPDKLPPPKRRRCCRYAVLQPLR